VLLNTEEEGVNALISDPLTDTFRAKRGKSKLMICFKQYFTEYFGSLLVFTYQATSKSIK
jgi:hypothetical protein